MDTGLLTPAKTRHSTWNILSWYLVHLALSIYQVSRDPFLADSVEMSIFYIILTSYNAYYSGLAVLKLVFAAVASFVKKYGLKRSVFYIICVSGLSYLIVHLLDVSTIQTGAFLQDSIVRRLEKSVVEIEEARGPIKQRHTTGIVPYSIEEHTKYSGEDVEFNCYRLMAFSEDVLPSPDQVVWEKNGKVLKPSEHIRITWSSENVTDSQGDTTHKHFLISSKITIVFVDGSDYGNYSCYVKNWMYVKTTPRPKPVPEPQCPLNPLPEGCYICCICVCEPPPPPPPRLQITHSGAGANWKSMYTLVKVFSLVRMRALLRRVYAPPGGIFSFSATYDHLGDENDVTMNYNIARNPFEMACGWEFGGCSMSVVFYWLFFHKGGHSNTFLWQQTNVRMRTAVTGTGWLCVCKRAYDYHEVSFFRRMYNATSGLNEFWEVKYPHTILLAPRTPDLMFPNFTNTVDPLARTPCWADQKEHMTDTCKQEEQGVEWVIWFYLHIELIVLTFAVISGIVLVCLVSKLTTKMIVIPLRNKILEGSFRVCKSCCMRRYDRTLGGIKEDHGPVKHDVFISHSKDQLISSRELRDMLKNYGLRTFLAADDVLGGQLIVEAISNAIYSSDYFIVMLSEGYIESGLKNHFEFQLILKRFLEGQHDDRKLLLMRLDDSHIPEVLKRFCSLDWRINKNLKEKSRSLKKWTEGKSRAGEICNC